jgi:hypothetical protein
VINWCVPELVDDFFESGVEGETGLVLFAKHILSFVDDFHLHRALLQDGGAVLVIVCADVRNIFFSQSFLDNKL